MYIYTKIIAQIRTGKSYTFLGHPILSEGMIGTVGRLH